MSRDISIGEFQSKFADVMKSVGKGNQFTVLKRGEPMVIVMRTASANVKGEDVKFSAVGQWVSTRQARMNLSKTIADASSGILTVVTNFGVPIAIIKGIN